ncbi:MAG: hypothetical protein HUJ30_00290 [Gammaproteobacteria bacterium]|nr:hypothetical protein [Gammaproteobacteria bacterium]
MDEFKFKIGKHATHNPTATKGRVIALHIDRHEQKEVRLEYKDDNNLVVTQWFPECELVE